MTHPEELLAGYVDGTLPARERAAVDLHVAECGRCHREIMLAAGARAALRTVPEVPAPPGIASDAIAEAGGTRRSAGAQTGTPRWYRVGGAVAAVAAGLLVLTLVLPHVGQGEGSGAVGNERRQDSAAIPGAPTALKASMIEVRHVNYDNASLSALTASYRTAAPSGGAAAAEASPAPVFGTQTQTSKAIACVTASAPDETGVLQSLIRARFAGTPAYLAVFLEGPGAGQEEDTVSVWVFATDDCRILSFSTAQL